MKPEDARKFLLMTIDLTREYKIPQPEEAVRELEYLAIVDISKSTDPEEIVDYGKKLLNRYVDIMKAEQFTATMLRQLGPRISQKTASTVRFAAATVAKEAGIAFQSLKKLLENVGVATVFGALSEETDWDIVRQKIDTLFQVYAMLIYSYTTLTTVELLKDLAPDKPSPITPPVPWDKALESAINLNKRLKGEDLVTKETGKKVAIGAGAVVGTITLVGLVVLLAKGKR